MITGKSVDSTYAALLQIVTSTCQTFEALKNNPNTTEDQRNALDQLCATCHAFDNEKEHIKKDILYLRTFLTEMSKSAQAVRKLIPASVLEPLEGVIKMYLSKLPLPTTGLFESTSSHRRRRARRTTRRTSTTRTRRRLKSSSSTRGKRKRTTGAHKSHRRRHKRRRICC
jgi:hypothetical protein